MADLNKFPEDVKRDLVRLMILLNETDLLKEEYPSKKRPTNIQNTIDLLTERAELIRLEFLKDKKKQK